MEDEPCKPQSAAPARSLSLRAAQRQHRSRMSTERAAYLRSLVRDVPDFPKPGILFKDITPLLAEPRAFAAIIDGFVEELAGQHIDAIVGIEARGFIFGAALAARLACAFVPVRKPGKLPAAVDRVSYALEYGEGHLEMHKGALREGDRAVIIDDLLATGGTAAASADLIRKQGAEVLRFLFVIELSFLEGRNKLLPTPMTALLRY
jgi:adenine phosphoribosyltransferase